MLRTVDTIQYVQLPDGTYAALIRSVTWGESIVILLLVALLFLQLYEAWKRTRCT